MEQKRQQTVTLSVSAPGRICLFGEHQDYLDLPVITFAINRRLHISGRPIPQMAMHIDLPDIHDSENFSLPETGKEIPYVKERDYWRSVFNVLLREGLTLKNGWQCKVQGNIPINSGTSSSSALCVAWARFLCEISEVPLKFCSDAPTIARLAHLAEVVEFGEPGGMMDHYASAVGGILYQEFGAGVRLTPLPAELGTFVLGDSLQPKDTKGILARVKFGVLRAVEKIQKQEPKFNLQTVTKTQLQAYRNLLTTEEFEVLQGAVLNRDLTQQALSLLQTTTPDEKQFGQLLNEHQNILAQLLKISTPKIDHMLNAALQAGALGGKINGSGGGGCMFVYAPQNPQKIARAIENAGGKAYIIQKDTGVQID